MELEPTNEALQDQNPSNKISEVTKLESQELKTVSGHKNEIMIENQDAEPLLETQEVHWIYKDFSEQEKISLSEDRKEIMDRLKTSLGDKLNWRGQTESVDALRSQNKFYNNEIDEIQKLFQFSVVECIDSLRSSVSKNSLMFIHEFFSNSKNFKISADTLTVIVPIQLHRAVGDKAFIRQEASRSIQTLVNNCVYDASFVEILKECDNKIFQIGELALDSVSKLILNIGENFSKLEHATLCSLLTVLSTVVSGKRRNMATQAQKSLESIQKLWGRENYSKFINVLHSEGYVNDKLLANLNVVLKEKKVVKQQKSMKDQIKERKAAGFGKSNQDEVNGGFGVAVKNNDNNVNIVNTNISDSMMIIEEKSPEAKTGQLNPNGDCK